MLQLQKTTEDVSSGGGKKTHLKQWCGLSSFYSVTDDIYRRLVSGSHTELAPGQSNSWFSTCGRGGSKLEQWGRETIYVEWMRSQFYPPCVIPVQLTRPQPSIFNVCWSWATDGREKTQWGRRIGLPRSFQPCNKLLNITTAKSHGGLPLQTEQEACKNGFFCRGYGDSLGFIVGILAEDNEALQDGGDREVLLRGQLSPFSMSQQHRRGVGLETCDGLWLTCLAHNIHSL